ncbi:MAG: hypothetical protein QNL05_02985, partial [Gammaproteobacteria bacterium]|nr:hypothetical protein [Gammaproteobacteria bacterium]MDX2486515.1 hypothetical protein [Gammaproteobacteria bacterium]
TANTAGGLFFWSPCLAHANKRYSPITGDKRMEIQLKIKKGLSSGRANQTSRAPAQKKNPDAR